MGIKKLSAAIWVVLIALVILSTVSVSGWIIEPDNIIYGQIYEDGVLITQADTSCTVTLEVAGEEVARYVMGQIPTDYYVLNVPIVSTNTHGDPKPFGFSVEGEEGVIKLNGQQVDSPLTIVVGPRGTIHYQDISSQDISSVDFCIILKQGLNIIGYPSIPPAGYSAFEFLQDVSEIHIIGISRLNHVLMRAENAGWIEGELEGDDFPIQAGEGYIVYMKKEKSQCASGDPPGKVILSLKQGINIISIPGTSTGYSAFDFLQTVGAGYIISISRLNHALMRAENAGWIEGEVDGDDFPIEDEEGYIVYMKQDRETMY